jgi:hypothetical protein
MKPGSLVSLISRLKRSHPVTGRLSAHVRQLPATCRRPECHRQRARHRLSPPAICPLGVYMCRASILIAHGLSSKPSPFPSPREAMLPPCLASRSTLPLIASADDRVVSAASCCACGCPRPQAGAVPRRTPERPNAIIPFGCPPTTASSELLPPSSAASSHELPPPHRVDLAATPTPLAAGKLPDLGSSAIACHEVPCFDSGLPAHGGLGQMFGLARFGPMEQFLAISRNLFESSSI